MAGPDPLEMAENCVAAVRAMAELAVSDPVQGHIAMAGARGTEGARMAGSLALVSIARDLRRIADKLMSEAE